MPIKTTIPEGRYQNVTMECQKHNIVISVALLHRTVLIKLYPDGTWEEL